MKRFNLFATSLALLTSLFIVSCGSDNDDPATPPVTNSSEIVVTPTEYSIASEGGALSINYTIINATEGTTLQVQSEAEWVEVESVTDTSIELSIAANELYEARNTSLRLTYEGAKESLYLTLTQQGKALDNFAIEISNLRYNGFTMSVTPKDEEMLYVISTISTEYFRMSGIKDGATFIAKEMDNFQEIAKNNDMTLEELLWHNIDKDVVIGGEADGTVSDGDKITVVIVSTKEVEEKENIPYQTVYVEDASLYKGESEVAVEGQNGFVTRKYSVTYQDGVEVKRTLISEVKTEPVNKVVSVGTKVYFTNNRGFNDSFSIEYDMVATAYSPTPENWGYATASGNRAREGVVAVDRKVIPLGTKLYVKSNVPGIPDYGYCIAWDVGGAIKNMRIDLFMESEDDCNRFGKRDVTVYVLEDQTVDVFALRG